MDTLQSSTESNWNILPLILICICHETLGYPQKQLKVLDYFANYIKCNHLFTTVDSGLHAYKLSYGWASVPPYWIANFAVLHI